MGLMPSHQWLFEESGGSIAVDEVGTANGTLSFAQRFSPGFVSISALYLDGANDSFVSFPDQVGRFGTSDFTVAFWMKTSETLRLFDIIGNRTAFSDGNYFSIRMTGNHETLAHGIVIVEIDGDARTHPLAVSSTVQGLNDGKWHHVAASRRGATLSLYIDGQPAGTASGTAAANVSNANPFKLGRSLVSADTPRFAPNAMYDDLRIYDVALDAAAIVAFIDWNLPDDQRLIFASSLLETGDQGFIVAANEKVLSLDDGRLIAISAERKSEYLFIFLRAGEAFHLIVDSKVVRVADDGKLVATSSNRATATPFYPYLTDAGEILLATDERKLWRLDDESTLSVAVTERAELVNEFTLNLLPRTQEELMQQLGLTATPALTECEKAEAHLVWQLTGALFLAMGLGPFVANEKLETGLLGLLRSNANVWRAVEQAIEMIGRNSQLTGKAAAVVLGAIWSARLMRPLLVFVLSTLGWYALYRVLARILIVVFAPEEEVGELLAGMVVWSAQTVQAAVQVTSKCKKRNEQSQRDRAAPEPNVA